jgi:hypothetical protein
MWKDRHERRKNNEERLIQETLGALQTQISQLENLVKELPQDNQIDAQRDALAEIFRQEINVLSDIARQTDALQAEIFRLEGVRRALAKDNQLDDRISVSYRNSPPDLSADNSYWGALSSWIREEKRWTCENEKCRINLEDRRSDLHVHHIFGRGFNSPQHLKVLCIACHAEEPGHEFMKAHPKYEAFLKWKRRLL